MIARLFFCFFLLLLVCPGFAADSDVNLKELTDVESHTREIEDNSRAGVVDKQGKTPLAAALLLRDAVSKKDWQAAAQFIDTRYLSDEVAQIGAPELIRRLALVWRQQRIVDYTTLSDAPEGNLNDGLPSYRDLLGELKTSSGPIAVYLQRVPDGHGGRVWKVSNATLGQVPMLWQEFGYNPRIEALARLLPEFTLLHMENWQFVAFVLLILGSFFIAYLITWLLSQVCRGETVGRIARRFVVRTLRWFLIFKLIDHGVGSLGLSLKAKLWFASGLFGYLAGLFLLLGMVEIFTAVYLLRSQNRKNKLGTAIVRPLSTTLKVIMAVVMLLSWLSDAGYSITTLLTGLGIGSLAVALAAQKTLENIFGAFTLYVARPIAPGDFCKFGDIMGTVEEIGLRSTRIRTLDRKVVHVPNSEFSSKNLTNFSEIDRRHFQTTLRLGLTTSADEIRELLIALRELLLRHEKVLDTARRVRFEEIAPDAFIVVINAYIAVKSIVEYKAVAEDLNLHVVEILQKLGMTLMPPQQHVAVVQTAAVNSDERAQSASELIQKLREEQRLPFPDFDSATKEALQNTLGWPPEGHFAQKKEE